MSKLFCQASIAETEPTNRELWTMVSASRLGGWSDGALRLPPESLFFRRFVPDFWGQCENIWKQQFVSKMDKRWVCQMLILGVLDKLMKLLGWRGKLLGGKSSARKEPCWAKLWLHGSWRLLVTFISVCFDSDVGSIVTRYHSDHKESQRDTLINHEELVIPLCSNYPSHIMLYPHRLEA